MMNIGLTFDLRSEYRAMGYSEEDVCEFDGEDTIAAIESALREEGMRTERIGNVLGLVQRLARGERWGLVFNIAEGLRGFGREAQVPCLLEAYGIPYTFSDPLALSITMHKPTAKRLVRSHGIPTPDFAVVASEEELTTSLPAFPVFVKPVAEGTGKGIDEGSVAGSRSELVDVVKRLVVRYAQPVLVESFLPGREITVGIVGTGDDARSVGVLEVFHNTDRFGRVYSYHVKENCEQLVYYRLASDSRAAEASRMALDAWRILGCRDGGRVDLRANGSGEFQFLEVNPLAGLHPTHSDLPILWEKTGGRYRDLIGSFVCSALTRTAWVPRTMQNGLEQAVAGGGDKISEVLAHER